MNYVYHMIPPLMRGNVLYPLNQLKEVYPELYKEQVEKYNGREWVRKGQILPLNCMWGDVLHLSAVHPAEIQKALLEACPVRLRPILMTSVATVAAAIPEAMAFGAGSEAMVPMAVAIVGGVTVSTVLTLFVVPCAYEVLSRFEKHSYEPLEDMEDDAAKK